MAKTYNPNARRGMLAKVHMAKKQLAMEDDTYRMMLWDRYEQDSAGKLSLQDLGDLIEHMEAIGATYALPEPRDKQTRKIRAMWLALAEEGVVRDSSEEALRVWVKRQTRVDRLEWLNPAQASQVIEALKQWNDRIEDQLQEGMV